MKFLSLLQVSRSFCLINCFNLSVLKVSNLLCSVADFLDFKDASCLPTKSSGVKPVTFVTQLPLDGHFVLASDVPTEQALDASSSLVDVPLQVLLLRVLNMDV